jgi:hypothetical protein
MRWSMQWVWLLWFGASAEIGACLRAASEFRGTL